MLKRYLAPALLLALCAASPAAAQSFNLDFQDSFTGLPDTFGAASGQTGTWVDVDESTTIFNLTDITGSPTAVSITLEGIGTTFHPQTTTASILLRDKVQTGNVRNLEPAFSAILTALADGEYELYYYSNNTSGLTANGTLLDNLAGGSIDNIGPQGTNWDVATVTVSGGLLEILAPNQIRSNGLSGIQLVQQQQQVVPEPGSLAVWACTALGGLWFIRRRLRK